MANATAYFEDHTLRPTNVELYCNAYNSIGRREPSWVPMTEASTPFLTHQVCPTTEDSPPLAKLHGKKATDICWMIQKMYTNIEAEKRSQVRELNALYLYRHSNVVVKDYEELNESRRAFTLLVNALQSLLLQWDSPAEEDPTVFENMSSKWQDRFTKIFEHAWYLSQEPRAVLSSRTKPRSGSNNLTRMWKRMVNRQVEKKMRMWEKYT